MGNYCSAPILASTHDCTEAGIALQSSYAYIGHFSRYIRPGAERIVCAPAHDDLDCTAFRNTDGKIAVVVMNRSDADLPFALHYSGRSAPLQSPAHSISTFRFRE